MHLTRITVPLLLLAALLAAVPAHAESGCSQTVQGSAALVDVRCSVSDPTTGSPLVAFCVQLLTSDSYLEQDSVSLFGTPFSYSVPAC
ncbi:MAG TPA: hypothetical protein VM241_02585 [Candidatus Thermoplasmatota archaeon]|nr:hypothetical protein [Candidatus Thermoplasmatota archaeon]